MRHLTIIGGGTIGAAVARAVVDAHFVQEDSLTIIEREHGRQEHLRKIFSRAVIVDRLPELLTDSVLLSVKPQDAPQMYSELRGHLEKGAMIYSFMAGVPMRALEAVSGNGRIVRVMTNTPLILRRALSVWMAGKGIRTREKQEVRDFLSVFGAEEEVQDENLLDVATAVSGSGPAYFFTFFEALVEAAVSLGLSRAQAEKWVRATALGAGALWENADESLNDMIQSVKSKGGTTEAALGELPSAELTQMWTKALARAYARAKELSDIRQ